MEDSESLDDAVTDFFHKNQDPNYLIASSAEGVIQGKIYLCQSFKAHQFFFNNFNRQIDQSDLLVILMA